MEHSSVKYILVSDYCSVGTAYLWILPLSKVLYNAADIEWEGHESFSSDFVKTKNALQARFTTELTLTSLSNILYIYFEVLA